MTLSRETAFVTDIAVVGAEDLVAVGGKGANLGELVRAGFAVPEAMIVTTAAYAAAVDAGGLAATIAEELATGGDGAAVRAAFACVELPADVRAQIAAAYAALGEGPVAVRSSATAEDLPGAAFAGQQDTFLNAVREDAVLDAVRRCWASLWTERAIAYRRRMGVDPAGVRMAVVVQRMVDAEFAGVLFTANPVSGERGELVVDANPGLGEAVVSGLVTPDHYVLDERGAVRDRVPGRREVVVRPVAGGGVAHERRAAADGAPLPDAVLAELARIGRSVAAHFGRPQDIEWAYANGRIWLVQARPMTALPPPPLHLTRLQRAATVQLMDYLTVRPRPIDVSAWIRPGIAGMVSRMLGENLGVRVEIADMLIERDGVVERFEPRLPRPTWRTLTAPARFLRRARRADLARWAEDPRLGRFQSQVRELTETDLRALGWRELLRVPRRAVAAMELVVDLRVDYLPPVALALLRLRLTLAALGLAELFPLLITGGRTRTDDTNRALEGLAALVRGDEELSAAFARLDPAPLLARIERAQRFAGFAVALRAFLTEYGHRETLSPLLLSEPTWAEAPATVLGLVGVLAEQPRAPGPDRGAQALDRLLAQRLVVRTRSGPAVRRSVEAARAGVVLREDTHFHATAVLPVLRRAVLECGRRLGAARVLRDADVVHLRLEELEEIDDPAALPAAAAERLRALVTRRAARRAELAGVPMVSPADLIPPDADDPDVLVSGMGASGGRATGPVRVIHGPEHFASLRAGEVLVCPYTNPGWTPLFHRAAAVVVDSGGLGSHAAIVAREYGVPAVMATVRGTDVLPDGQHVTVDGDTGRVTAART
jgi:pyruvate,water dikinase